jgi:serine/threonine protein kinase
MEGGDFLMLLLQKAPLKENETRFYVAEMINGIDACHKLGFMHRDVKVSIANRLRITCSLTIFFFRQMVISKLQISDSRQVVNGSTKNLIVAVVAKTF